jgi:hypothetical protein
MRSEADADEKGDKRNDAKRDARNLKPIARIVAPDAQG